MSDSRDPFYIVQEEVNDTLNALLQKYEKLRGAPVNSAKWRSLDDSIQEECSSLKYMISELDKAIDNAEKNPQRFRLSQAEISDRRKWILSTRRRVEGVADGTLAPKQQQQQQGLSMQREPNRATSKLAAAVQEENNDFIRSEGERQQILMAAQDQELDVLSEHVVRIGELGREMGQELDTQGHMLDEFGMEMEGTQSRLAAAQKKVQSSAFVAARPVAPTRSCVAPTVSRPHLEVYASKGKQRMRTGGSKLQQQMMPTIPTPPVDPDNVEFVIFVRSTKLLQWMPLSVMKGGTAANLLVKSLENDLGKKLYGNTLVENIGKAIYQDKDAIEKTIREQFPMFKATKEFEFGFKIRDKENPKNWYQPIDVQVIPPQDQLGSTPLENVNNFFKDVGKNLGL